MASLLKEQLELIGQHLQEIESELEPILEEQKKLRAAALVLMQQENSKSEKTLFGNFTVVKGRTTKTYTSEEYIAAKEELEIAKLRAENRGQFTTTTGEDYLKFVHT
jgi:hypothetical protein